MAMAKLPERLDDEEEVDFEEEEAPQLLTEEEDEDIPVVPVPKREPAQRAKRGVTSMLADRQDRVMPQERAVQAPSLHRAQEPDEAPEVQVPEPMKKRYLAFQVEPRAGIVDTQTNQVVFDGVPKDFLWLAEILAGIENRMDEIREMVGRV